MAHSAVRTGVLSFRGVNNGPWNVHAFGLTDLVCDVFGGTTLSMTHPTNAATQKLTGMGKRLDLVRRVPGRVTVNPTIAQAGPLDLLFVVAHDMSDLDRLYLSADDWYNTAATKVLVLIEVWPSDAQSYPLSFSRVLPLFDAVYTCLESGADALREAAGVPINVLAQSVDVLHTPGPRPARCDVLSFGRRAEAQHELFNNWAAQRQGWYRYDTLALSDNLDIEDHRRSMADSMAFSAVTVCNYARFDNTARIGDLRVVGTRFWEIVASGSVPIGAAPGEDMWAREFGELPAIVELGLDCDTFDLTVVDDAVELGRDPKVRAAIRAFALERCDFAYRVQQILNDIRIPVPIALTDRLNSLNREHDRVLASVS